MAYCQWPEDFCYTYTGSGSGKKLWQEYWEEKLNKKSQPQKVGSTKNKEIIPTIEPEKKYSFTINAEIPMDTKYVKIR